MSQTNMTTLPPSAPGEGDEHRERFLSDPYGYLDTLTSELGPIFTLDLGALGNEGVTAYDNNGQWVFLCTPDLVRQMYAADTDATSGAAANAIFFGTNEKSVAYIDGTAHRRRRGQLLPLFSPTNDYTPLILKTARAHVESWPRDAEIELFPLLQAMTIDIIIQVVCADYPAEARDRLRSLLPRTESARVTRDDLHRADQETRAVIADVLAAPDRREHSGQPSVSRRLEQLTEEGDSSLTPEVLRDEVFSLLYTGFSTTANTLSWVLSRLSTDALALTRLREELATATNPAEPVHRALAGLPYLDAVISETLRLHPVTPLNGVRLTTRPVQIGDHLIPTGTVLVHCAHVLQRAVSVFDDARTFRPERFLDEPPRPYAWGAFGGGSRTCIGKSYSRAEMRAILSIVVPKLDIHLPGGLESPRQQGFFMAPGSWLRCCLTEASSRSSGNA